MNTGGAKRRTDGWWRRHSRSASMNPHRVRLRSGTIHRRDVERFKANPSARSSDGGPVCVVQLRDGSWFAREGAHRVTAAREAGRLVSVKWVHEREEQGR